jgi:hypothetical protein
MFPFWEFGACSRSGSTSATYADAVQAHFALSYAAKFAINKAGGPDFRASPSKGFWWADNLSTSQTGNKSE